MNQQSKNLAAVLAVLLLGAKVRANGIVLSGGERLSSAIEGIQDKVQADPRLTDVIPSLTKMQLENLIEQEISDGDYMALQKLLNGLKGENVPVEIVHPGGITLSTQEFLGGAK